MASFFKRLTLFLFPFAALIVLVNGALVYVGESMPLALVVMQQQNDEVLYRPNYGSRDQQFKLMSANARRAEVLAVGSSRVLQMRAGLLTQKPHVFYNAGAPAWQLEQVDALVRGLNDDALPEVLIIGVDPVWFNADYAAPQLPAPASDFETLFSVNRSMLQDIITGKREYDWARVFARHDPYAGTMALGTRALIDGHGFRSDGSEQYGDFLVGRYLDAATERERHLQWMRDGVDMYVYGVADSLDLAALARFEALLDDARARGVTVIAFAPPFAPTLYERMVRRGNHAYMDTLHARLRVMLEQRGFYYFDFSDSRQLNVTDADFFDGWHGSERVYLRLFAQMSDTLPDVLGRYTDADVLRAIDAAAGDTFRVF